MNTESIEQVVIPTTQELIDLLEFVPEEKWITGSYETIYGSCAMGHINKHYGNVAWTSPIEYGVRSRVMNFIGSKYNIRADIVNVNDTTEVNSYNEEHPKHRVLHLLRDMKEAGL